MKKYIILLAVAFTLNSIQGQEVVNKDNYKFEVLYNYDALPVQNQSMTGTCWSFSALSFFESELIRMGKGKHKLSEMFIVHSAYQLKAEKYVRMHGNINFAQGGAFHDIPLVIEQKGIVPHSVYQGLHYGAKKHNHSELEAVLKGMVDAIIGNPNGTLTPVWKNAVKSVLDTYLGAVPTDFDYNGKKYTPQSFKDFLGLEMDNYISITSFSHHSFYEKCQLAIPDNWAWGSSYNVPLDDFISALDHALENGFTVAWGSDVSEKGFAFRKALAIVPEDENTINQSGSDNQNFSDAGAEKISNAFETPVKEKEITQQVRQEAYDNYETQDDHGMHITGMVKDQNGTKYYIVKNSWGTTYSDYEGYFYASEAYVRYKSINIYLHKDALSKGMKKKLNL